MRVRWFTARTAKLLPQAGWRELVLMYFPYQKANELPRLISRGHKPLDVLVVPKLDLDYGFTDEKMKTPVARFEGCGERLSLCVSADTADTAILPIRAKRPSATLAVRE